MQLNEAKKANREAQEKIADLEDDLDDEKKSKARLEELRKQLEADLAASQSETGLFLFKKIDLWIKK